MTTKTVRRGAISELAIEIGFDRETLVPEFKAWCLARGIYKATEQDAVEFAAQRRNAWKASLAKFK